MDDLTKSTKESSDSVYSIYRVSNNGEPSIILQSEGCCMVDKNGKLTRETQRTMQSEMGEQAARAMASGMCFHFHVKVPPDNQTSSKPTSSKAAAEKEKK